MTNVLAEEVAKRILGVESSIQAVMIIDDLGKVLAHARADAFDLEEQDPEEVLPSLLTFPDHHVSVFLRAAPSSADPHSVYKTILGTLDGFGN
jgi:hypothetical protein